jgi:hypothetical protein
MPRLPQPVIIAACLGTGLGLGLAFPQNRVVLAIAQSGTWFPRTIVTLATAIVFVLMSAALARTLLSHVRGTRFLAILIGCLAIFIPARFGVRGLEVYGRTSLNLAIVALVWSAAMLLLVRATTRRTWPQIWKYFATVYVTGFGTGG